MDEAAGQPLAPKLFTPNEANDLLPQVIPLIKQLQQLSQSILKVNQQLDELAKKLAQGNGFPIQSLKDQMRQLTTHQFQLIEAFESALSQLEGLGAVLKDLSLGLVDFYGMREGQLICLCWKLGEAVVRFWHTPEEGYAGRQPLG